MGTSSSRLDGLRTEEVLARIGDYFESRHMSVQDAFRFIDTDNSKFISWDEFVRAVKLCIENTGHSAISHDSLWQIFQRFDTNKNGKLSVEEFAAAFNPSSRFGSSYYDANFHDRGLRRRSPGVGTRVARARPDSRVVDDIIGRLASSVVRTGFTPADVFNKLDKDGNGRLSHVELEQVLLSFDSNLSLTERNAIFARFDKDQSGSVDIYEFRTALEGANAGALVAVEDKIRYLGDRFKDKGYSLHECFSVFDRDEDGFLTRDEWQRVVRTLGSDMTDNDAEAVFRRFDDNGDGFLNIHEFQRFFRSALERAPESPFPQHTLDVAFPRSMPVYHAPPAEQPWETEVLDTVRHHLSKARCGLDIEEVFRRLDLTGSGNMTMYEFDRMITTYRSDLSREHLASLFEKVNHSGTGTISRGEFIRRFG